MEQDGPRLAHLVRGRLGGDVGRKTGLEDKEVVLRPASALPQRRLTKSPPTLALLSAMAFCTCRKVRP